MKGGQKGKKKARAKRTSKMINQIIAQKGGYIVAKILEYRKSEESRQQILAGLEEYKRQKFDEDYRRLQAACRVPLSEVERRRLQPTTIDRLMPWILVFGGFALIMVIGVLVNMLVNISAGLPAMYSAW
jgi:hypothetical protein